MALKKNISSYFYWLHTSTKQILPLNLKANKMYGICYVTCTHTEQVFTYSHSIYGTVKIKSELYEPTDIFESISNGEEIDISKDQPCLCCRVWSCSTLFTIKFALRWVLEGLGGNLSLCTVEHNTAVTSKQCHRIDLRSFALKQTNQAAKTRQVKRTLSSELKCAPSRAAGMCEASTQTPVLEPSCLPDSSSVAEYSPIVRFAFCSVCSKSYTKPFSPTESCLPPQINLTRPKNSPLCNNQDNATYCILTMILPFEEKN